MLALASTSIVGFAPLSAPAPRSGTVRARPAVAGLLDGVKDAFGGGDKPIVAADRVTPFDRWLGLDKDLEAELNDGVDQDVTYVDPSDASNYVSLSLVKPMGIAFVENEGGCGGVFVDEVLDSGSAASASPVLARGDQLVAVGSTLVLGWGFDATLDAIKASDDSATKLVLFRGPTSFLYGPTKASEEWYQENLL
mmetsp:Transcript_8512/g.26699  ORF Transcript_8512/g.26699 Transcript_8512/m.26699 type:complete len:195 (-) Transcript_8512:836-1420(-)